jgi:hypothetical protein
MKFYLKGLSREQIHILGEVGSDFSQRGFYLAGGTALAIYFEHRRSVDFDWFTRDSLGDALSLAQSLRNAGLDFVTDQTGPGTLHGKIMGVRVTFLEFRYPLLRPLTKWKEMGCAMASLDDLACMKLSAIAQRGQRRDFCDIYALGIKHRSLKEMLKLYAKKFKVHDISPILYGLAYFDDAESEPMPRMLWKVDWNTIKKTIQQWVEELGRG